METDWPRGLLSHGRSDARTHGSAASADSTLYGVLAALRSTLRDYTWAARRPLARDEQIGSDCDVRTSVSQRVGLHPSRRFVEGGFRITPAFRVKAVDG